MAYTRPQAAPAVANGTGSSIAKAFGSNVTAHSLLVAFATTDAGAPTFTFSSPGATWGNVTPFLCTSSGQWISIGWCLDAPAGATTITCSFGAAGSFLGLIVGEYAAPGGVASLLDTNTAGQNLSASTTPTDSSMAATVDDLIVSYVLASGATTITAGSGFAIIQQDATDIAATEDDLAGPGSIAPAFGFGTSRTSGIMSAAFKPADAAASPAVPLQRWPRQIGPWPRTQSEILAPDVAGVQVEVTTGEGDLGLGAESTAKKVAKITATTGASALGIGSLVTAKKINVATARGTAGIGSQVTVRKAAPAVASGSLGLVEIDLAAKKVATPALRGALGIASLAAATKRTTPLLSGAVGIGAIATSKKQATPLLRGALGIASLAAAKKITPGAGLGSLGLTTWAAHTDSRAVTSLGGFGLAGLATAQKKATPGAALTGTVGLTALGTVRHVATPALRAPAGLVGFATAKKRATPASAGAFGLLGIATGQKRATTTGAGTLGFVAWANRAARNITAFGWLGIGSSSTIKKRSTPLATSPLGLAAVNTAVTKKATGDTARGVFGLGSTAGAGRRQAVVARTIVGLDSWAVFVPPTLFFEGVIAGGVRAGPGATGGVRNGASAVGHVLQGTLDFYSDSYGDTYLGGEGLISLGVAGRVKPGPAVTGGQRVGASVTGGGR